MRLFSFLLPHALATLNAILLTLALVHVSACSVVGVPQPQTFAQRVAVGYASVTTVRQTATALLKAKRITVDDAENVQQQADNVRAALDIARTMHAADPPAAEAKLAQTRAVLAALNDYLAKKGSP